jgi:LacI family transcriptional regulator
VKKLAGLGRKRLALLAPPSTLSYYHHMRNGFLDAMEEIGFAEVPFNTVTVDHSIEQIRTRTLQLMQRPNPPDGIVSGAGGATFAMVAGIEDAGLRVGKHVDIVSKQSAKLLHLFRPELYVVNEDVRQAGRELARSVIALIDGAPAASLQSLSQPGPVLARGE